MSTLFWTAFAAMAGLLALRWIVPKMAPDSGLANWLTKRVSLGLDEPADEDRPAET